MTRPIVWAIGAVVSAALSGVSATSRVSGLNLFSPRAPASISQEGKKLVIAADLLGHFVVHPSLDGRRVRMLVDTGASVVALSHEDARLAGVRVERRDFNRRISTANGIVEAAPVRIAEIKIGDIAVRGVDAVVLPPGRLSTSLLGS